MTTKNHTLAPLLHARTPSETKAKEPPLVDKTKAAVLGQSVWKQETEQRTKEGRDLISIKKKSVEQH